MQPLLCLPLLSGSWRQLRVQKWAWQSAHRTEPRCRAVCMPAHQPPVPFCSAGTLSPLLHLRCRCWQDFEHSFTPEPAHVNFALRLQPLRAHPTRGSASVVGASLTPESLACCSLCLASPFPTAEVERAHRPPVSSSTPTQGAAASFQLWQLLGSLFCCTQGGVVVAVVSASHVGCTAGSARGRGRRCGFSGEPALSTCGHRTV